MSSDFQRLVASLNKKPEAETSEAQNAGFGTGTYILMAVAVILFVVLIMYISAQSEANATVPAVVNVSATMSDYRNPARQIPAV